MGEVPSAGLDVLPGNVGEECARVGIRCFLFVIVDTAVATSKLAAIPVAAERGRQDGVNKLSAAIDSARTAVYGI